MTTNVPAEAEISYELYLQLAEELSLPVEENIPLDMRYELYLSKIVYLKNLLGQCFRSVNTPDSVNRFTVDDFSYIQRSFNITKEFLRECILLSVKEKIERASVLYKTNTPSPGKDANG